MCSREIDGTEVTFGTTGYTKDRVFVLYDRDTDSIWYPLGEETFDAVAGPRKGKAVRFVSEPDPLPLREWLDSHPSSQVMLPPKEDLLEARRGYLGVRVAPDGVTIEEVIAGFAAAEAGLERGDRILRVGGDEVSSRRELQAALRKHQAGDAVKIAIDRSGKRLEVSVTLSRMPGAP